VKSSFSSKQILKLHSSLSKPRTGYKQTTTLRRVHVSLCVVLNNRASVRKLLYSPVFIVRLTLKRCNFQAWALHCRQTKEQGWQPACFCYKCKELGVGGVLCQRRDVWNGQIFNFIHKINFTGFVTAEHTHTYLYGLRKCLWNTRLTASAEISVIWRSSDNLKKIVHFFLRGRRNFQS